MHPSLDHSISILFWLFSILWVAWLGVCESPIIYLFSIRVAETIHKDESRRHEFMILGTLKQIPVKAVGISQKDKYREVKLRFHCPVTTTTLSPWNSFCEVSTISVFTNARWICAVQHRREGQWEEEKEQKWTTTFKQLGCSFCFQRLERQLENWITRSPDCPVTIMFTSADECCVEVRFVDPEDEVSEWTYWLWIWLPLEEREKLGSTI
jgi:hypothetical protein